MTKIECLDIVFGNYASRYRRNLEAAIQNHDWPPNFTDEWKAGLLDKMIEIGAIEEIVFSDGTTDANNSLQRIWFTEPKEAKKVVLEPIAQAA